MTDVFIGLGSNLGDRVGNIAAALEGISQLADTRLLAVSEVVETEPWGVTGQPSFANAVARIRTAMGLPRLLGELKELERRLGRVPGKRFGPRAIDLDILLAEDEVVHTETLVVPHPRLAGRQFALVPLLEIAPEATWPDGTPFEADAATEGRILRRFGELPGFEHFTVHPAGQR